MSVCPSALLSVCLSICPSVRLSVCPSVHLSRLSICPSFRLSVCSSVRPSDCLSARLSVCLSVRPSVRIMSCLTWCSTRLMWYFIGTGYGQYSIRILWSPRNASLSLELAWSTGCRRGARFSSLMDTCTENPDPFKRSNDKSSILFYKYCIKRVLFVEVTLFRGSFGHASLTRSLYGYKKNENLSWPYLCVKALDMKFPPPCMKS